MSVRFLVSYEIPFERVFEEFDDIADALSYGLSSGYDAKISVILGNCDHVLETISSNEFDSKMDAFDEFQKTVFSGE